MDDPQPTLLLTRPLPQSKTFLASCEAQIGHRLPVVISPVLRIEPLGDLPDLDRFRTLIFTSGNGVDRLGHHLAGRRVATVGDKTASRACEFGAEAQALGEDVEAFLANAAEIEAPALFCRGVHSRGDLAARLNGVGKEIEEAILYDQVSMPLSPAALTLLAGSAPVIAPVFSPRTAALLSKVPITAPVSLLALSPSVAQSWTRGGNVEVAERPDAKAMLALVVAAF